MLSNRFISGLLIVGFLAVVFIIATRQMPDHQTAAPVAAEPVDTAALTSPPPPPVPTPTFAGVIGKNMSFFNIMTACGVNPQDINTIAKAAKSVYDLRRVYPGQSYECYTDTAGGIETFILEINNEGYIEVGRDGDDFSVVHREYPFETDMRSASGLIEHSLYTSILGQSLPVELGAKLTDIFAWDIDFFTEIRKNDYFRVIYEEKRRADVPEAERETRIGRIISAEFNTSGVSHYAFLFENETGLADYFDQDGKSLRKQLLKAPLSYTRISSSFNRRRFHPVLHHYAPHYGLDYTAPAGTPVMSTGDGTVTTASYRRGNGNYVKIRHNSNYITYYLHLSRFAKGIKAGVKVKQGQVIGYVGSTGYATGPHLDYRVKKNDRFVNPRKIKLPPANPVSEGNMARFQNLRDDLIGKMQRIPIKDWRTEYFAESTSSSTVKPTGTDNKNAHQTSVTH